MYASIKHALLRLLSFVLGIGVLFACLLFGLVLMSIIQQGRSELIRSSLLARAKANGGCATLLETGLFQRGFAVHAATYFNFRVVEVRGDAVLKREVPTAPGCESAEPLARNRTPIAVVEVAHVLGGVLQNVTLHDFASQCAQHANDLYHGIWSCAILHKEATL